MLVPQVVSPLRAQPPRKLRRSRIGHQRAAASTVAVAAAVAAVAAAAVARAPSLAVILHGACASDHELQHHQRDGARHERLGCSAAQVWYHEPRSPRRAHPERCRAWFSRSLRRTASAGRLPRGYRSTATATTRCARAACGSAPSRRSASRRHAAAGWPAPSAAACATTTASRGFATTSATVTSRRHVPSATPSRAAATTPSRSRRRPRRSRCVPCRPG